MGIENLGLYNITIDFNKMTTYVPTNIYYKENDTNTAKIKARLIKDGVAINLSNTSASVEIITTSGVTINNSAIISDAENGIIDFTFPVNALIEGVNFFEIILSENGMIKYSPRMAYKVLDSIEDTGVEVETNYPILLTLIADVNNVLNEEKIRVSNEILRQSLKDQMDTLKSELELLQTNLNTLESTAANNETTRQNNEVLRQTLNDQMGTLKSDLELLQTNLNTLDSTISTNESTRQSNETLRQTNVNTKITEIDNKIVDVENRVISKENLIDSKIIEVEGRVVTKETLVDNKIIEANTTIENVNLAKSNTEIATNNANTKITEVEVVKQDVITTKDNLVAQFNALAPANATNAEVQLARTDVAGKTYASLQERLLADNKQQNILYASVSGAYITSDSVDGYAKNVTIEGNTYQDPAVLSTIKSTGTKLSDGRYEIPLLSVGKNICPYIELGGIDAATGLDNVYITTRTGYCRVKPNTNYILSRNGVSRVANIFYYDVNKKFISKDAIVKANFTTLSNCVYVRFFFGTSLEDNIQLEEGSVSTIFESYKENKLTILSDVQIEKVGTVADRILQIVDKWNTEKNVITKILNGSEIITFDSSQTKDNTLLFSYNPTNSSSYSKCICDKFKYEANWDSDTESIYINQSGIIYIRILKTKLVTLDVIGFKAWLLANNVLIKYITTVPTFIPLPDDQQVALRTFAPKTNISFLTEIEGTIKCDVPKSTQASINSINLHLDSVDESLEKIKKLEDATNSTVVTDKDFVNIGDTSNGYLSDVKLEGRTLVNKWKDTFFKAGGTDAITTDIDYVTFTNPTAYSFTRSTMAFNFEVGKKYTFIVNVIENTHSNFVCFLENQIGNAQNSNSVTLVKGLNVFTLTPTTENTPNIRFACQSANASSISKISRKIVVLEGEHLYQNQYFEGLKSVGQDVNKIVVSSVNASGNLFDGMLEIGSYDNITGLPTASVNYRSINYININNSIECYVKLTDMTLSPRIFYYDKNKSYISTELLSNATTKKITIPTNAYFIKFHIGGVTSSTSVYIGKYPSNVKDYVAPDKKEILYLDTVDSTWKKPVLRGKWESGKLIFGDTVEKLADGKYRYRNGASEVVLNGSETGWVTAAGTTNCSQFQLDTGLTGAKPLPTLICDKFIQNNSTIDDNEGISASPSVGSRIYIRVLKTKLATQDIAGFKAWLQANPVKIVYPLAEEKVYECAPIDLASYSTETNFYLESGVLSPRSTIKVQNYIGSIINNLKEQVSVLQNKVYKENITMMTMLLNHEARLIAHSI